MKTINKFVKIVLMISIAILISFPAFCEDCMEIAYDTFENKRRPEVCFVHDEHNEMAQIDECNVCHHVYEDGKFVEDDSSEGITCFECHGDADDPRQMELIVRYHTQCRSCHLDVKKGPVTCGGCHKK